MTLGGEDITNLQANQLVQQGVGFVPQNNNVFPSLTIEENLQMGALPCAQEVRRAVRVHHAGPVPHAAASAAPARGRAVRR